MYGRIGRSGVVAGLCVAASVAGATEPFVQDFDGWKITIRPGVSALGDSVPPGPQTTGASAKGTIRLVSFQEPPAPAPALAPAGSRPAARPTETEDGFPVINPGESDWCCDSTTKVSAPEGSVDPRYLSQMYNEIYKSIPFIRAEYHANPSYIHDTTVEFLFGKMRPTVIQRGTTVIRHDYPAGFDQPWAYGGYGGFGGYGYGGYGYPGLQLVVPGTGLRVHHLN